MITPEQIDDLLGKLTQMNISLNRIDWTLRWMLGVVCGAFGGVVGYLLAMTF